MASLLVELGRDVSPSAASNPSYVIRFGGHLALRESRTLVAEAPGGGLLGFLDMEFRQRLGHPRPQAWVNDLVVTEPARRQGVGSSLLGEGRGAGSRPRLLPDVARDRRLARGDASLLRPRGLDGQRQVVRQAPGSDLGLDRLQRVSDQRDVTSASAIWTAFSAAPLRRLSPHAKSQQRVVGPSDRADPPDEDVVDPGGLERGRVDAVRRVVADQDARATPRAPRAPRRPRPGARTSRGCRDAVADRHRDADAVAVTSRSGSARICLASRAILTSSAVNPVSSSMTSIFATTLYAIVLPNTSPTGQRVEVGTAELLLLAVELLDLLGELANALLPGAGHRLVRASGSANAGRPPGGAARRPSAR